MEIVTCNSMYEKGECVGGYHEIHKINFLQNVDHAIATINSVIKNNLLYGCEDTVLEDVIVSCSDDDTTDKINKYYQEHPTKVKVTANFDYM